MSEMTVGCIRTTVTPPLAGGIYEALLEKAERERNEAQQRLREMEDQRDFAMGVIQRLERERDEAREESLEQARLLGKGGEREARLATERDHYKQAIEEISVTIQDWLDSIVQEPSLDFIKAIKAWADKKLKEL
jgi:hypothetical protein